MADIVSFQPVRALDANGQPVPGALARFFLSGTTTPVTVYADVNETTAHPSPLQADANGIFPAVYRSGIAMRVTITTPAGSALPGSPIDPAITVPAGGGAASQISFDPTGSIPETNVQAAIERVQANFAAPLLEGGLGATGSVTLLGNLDATNTPSGFNRWDDTTTGTFPASWGGTGESGVVYFLRETSANGVQFIFKRDSNVQYMRRLESGAWEAWVRTDVQTLDGSTWNAGTSTTEALISPAKLAAAVEEYNPTPSVDFGPNPQWVDVTRSAGTTYQNDTGYAIQLSVTASRSNSGIGVQISADGSSWSPLSETGGSGRTTHNQIIPNGLYYRLTVLNNIDRWWEFRNVE